jgi:hypothetical protein
MLEIDRWPDLRDPVLVVALSGWVDAGLAGAGAAAVLSEQLDRRRISAGSISRTSSTSSDTSFRSPRRRRRERSSGPSSS